MPTEQKIEKVYEMRRWMEKCTIAISTDYTGMSVTGMTALRTALRDRGVEFQVVKNTLAYLAADAADRPSIKDVVEGPTGIAFTYGDPVEPAKALTEFIRDTRASIKIRGGVMGEQMLTAAQVDSLATLPPKDILLAQLMGQLQGPVAGLVRVLNEPIAGLARVLQRHSEDMG